MKKRHLIYLSCLFSWELNAQLGVTATRTLTWANEWQSAAEYFIFRKHTDFLKYGVSASVEYQLPLKNKRWFLAPALNVTQVSYGFEPARFEVSTTGAQANLTYYLSPSKTEDESPKGLALQVSPGLDWVRKMYFPPFEDGKRVRITDAGLAFHAGIGAFFQCPVSERLSIAPFAQIRLYPGMVWEDLTELVSAGAQSGTFDRTNWVHVNLGVKAGLKW